ncbi:MAG: type IV toxin-antitoxin system AbiEi family antitoxin domain-containing protein [bacterium]
MKVDSLIEKFADQPVVESAALITFIGDAATARVQISRWVSSGRLIQLRRGYYLLAPKLRRREPDVHYIANVLCAPSYVSLTYALGFYGMIPEAVVTVTSVTTRRPVLYSTPIARFEYRHIAPHLFWGYETQEPQGVTPVQIALPEKALLDLIYLTPGKADEVFFESLRLQHLDVIDAPRLHAFAARFGGRKMPSAARAYEKYASIHQGRPTP